MKIIYKDGHVDECPQDQELHVIRHTAAHIMAQAIKRLYPQADFAFGPATENGFYYDVDLGDQKLSDEDLANIEKEMRKIVKENLPIKPFILPRAEAVKLMEERKENYKIEHMADLADETEFSFFQQGINNAVVAEIVRRSGGIHHQLHPVKNPKIGFVVHGKKPVVAVQRVGAPDFNGVPVVGGGHALHNGRGNVPAQRADGVGTDSSGAGCACQKGSGQSGSGDDSFHGSYLLFAFVVCVRLSPGRFRGGGIGSLFVVRPVKVSGGHA